MESVKIKGTKRTEVGKKTSKALRREKQVPCVIYGRNGNFHFSVHKSAFKNLVYTPAFKLAEIDIDGAMHNCILKEVQFHPVSDAIVHADFIELTDGVPVKVSIPVNCIGVSIGEKAGGKLISQLRKVNIKAFPENLVAKMEVDISHLELGQSVKVKDLIAVEGVEVSNSPNIPIASVEVPRALKSAEDEAEKAEVEETAEAEV